MVSLSLAALTENNIASRWYSKTCFFQSDEATDNIDTSTISPPIKLLVLFSIGDIFIKGAQKNS